MLTEKRFSCFFIKDSWDARSVFCNLIPLSSWFFQGGCNKQTLNTQNLIIHRQEHISFSFCFQIQNPTVSHEKQPPEPHWAEAYTVAISERPPDGRRELLQGLPLALRDWPPFGVGPAWFRFHAPLRLSAEEIRHGGGHLLRVPSAEEHDAVLWGNCEEGEHTLRAGH